MRSAGGELDRWGTGSRAGQDRVHAPGAALALGRREIGIVLQRLVLEGALSAVEPNIVHQRTATTSPATNRCGASPGAEAVSAGNGVGK